jgi:hypothetical protein
MRIHTLSPLDAVTRRASTRLGLSRPEVDRRLHGYGRNKVEKSDPGVSVASLHQDVGGADMLLDDNFARILKLDIHRQL